MEEHSVIMKSVVPMWEGIMQFKRQFIVYIFRYTPGRYSIPGWKQWFCMYPKILAGIDLTDRNTGWLWD